MPSWLAQRLPVRSQQNTFYKQELPDNRLAYSQLDTLYQQELPDHRLTWRRKESGYSALGAGKWFRSLVAIQQASSMHGSLLAARSCLGTTLLPHGLS